MERRSDNRLVEIAEVLAHHYAETSRNDKAFTYLALAGNKSLDVYSLEEAEQYYRKALAIFEVHNTCADRPVVVASILRLLETLEHKSTYREMGQVARKFMPLIRKGGETTELVIASYYEGVSLLNTLDFRGAHELAAKMLAVSERLGDGRARVYARGFLLFTRFVLGLDSLEVADQMKAKLMDDSLQFGDNFIRIWAYWFIAFDYLYRGLFKESRETAVRLVRAGEMHNDPRALGLASQLLGYIDVVADAPLAAMAHAEDCLRIAVIRPIAGRSGKGAVLHLDGTRPRGARSARPCIFGASTTRFTVSHSSRAKGCRLGDVRPIIRRHPAYRAVNLAI